MATIRKVDEIPIEGRFSFETSEGVKYEGPLEKKDLILRWLIKTHKENRKYPRRVYESLDEIFISPVLFLPDDLVSEVGKFVETPRLKQFNQTMNKRLFPTDQRRLQNVSKDSKYRMYYGFGNDGDVESFFETIILESSSASASNYATDFVRGMLNGGHYRELYKVIKKLDKSRDKYRVSSIGVKDGDAHTNACILILVSYGFIDFENYFSYSSDEPLPMEEWDALFDFGLEDFEITNCILSAAFTGSENMSDEIIDHLVTKRPTLARLLLSKVLYYWITDRNNYDNDQNYERYYRLLKKYSHLINLSKLPLAVLVIDYGIKNNKFQKQYDLETVHKNAPEVPVGVYLNDDDVKLR